MFKKKYKNNFMTSGLGINDAVTISPEIIFYSHKHYNQKQQLNYSIFL